MRNRLAVTAAAFLLTTAPVWAMGGFGNSSSDDLGDAKRLIDKYEYRGAIQKLQVAVQKNPNSADAYNYLGYSHRKLKEFTEAAAAYDKALRLDPRHKGALEYQGELLIETGDIAGAERNLAALQGLCSSRCEERDALAKAVANAKAGKGS